MAKKILGPRGERRARLLLIMSAAITAFAIFFVTGASGVLPGGSTFESGDGNLIVNTTGLHDWNSPVEAITCPATAPGSGANCGLDLVKNQGDNALGQGSKEDQTNVTIVDGSIPPSKDDLSRFYVNHEKVTFTDCGGTGVNTCDFLYLAWQRSNLLGSAHLDFELNKNPVGIDSSSVGPVTLNRTAGDRLIDFDFSGSGTPVLAVHTWILSGAAGGADCEASNSYPCWNKGTTLDATQAEAAVNCTPVVDTNPPGAPRTLDGNSKNGCNSTFGEAGVNLQKAGIISGNSCTSFTDAWLKSRSSGNSFTSELKDIIAPIPLSLTNCGALQISKVSAKSGAAALAGAVFSVTGPNNFSTSVTTDSNGHACLDSLPKGSYTVTETTPPAGYEIATDPQTVSVPASEATCNDDPFVGVVVTFENNPLTDLTITVASQDTGPGGSSSTITCTKVSDSSGIGNSPQTGNSATVTANDLSPGHYDCDVVIDP